MFCGQRDGDWVIWLKQVRRAEKETRASSFHLCAYIKKVEQSALLDKDQTGIPPPSGSAALPQAQKPQYKMGSGSGVAQGSQISASPLLGMPATDVEEASNTLSQGMVLQGESKQAPEEGSWGLVSGNNKDRKTRA
jgi:hypothetical protein